MIIPGKFDIVKGNRSRAMNSVLFRTLGRLNPLILLGVPPYVGSLILYWRRSKLTSMINLPLHYCLVHSDGCPSVLYLSPQLLYISLYHLQLMFKTSYHHLFSSSSMASMSLLFILIEKSLMKRSR